MLTLLEKNSNSGSVGAIKVEQKATKHDDGARVQKLEK